MKLRHEADSGWMLLPLPPAKHGSQTRQRRAAAVHRHLLGLTDSRVRFKLLPLANGRRSSCDGTHCALKVVIAAYDPCAAISTFACKTNWSAKPADVLSGLYKSRESVLTSDGVVIHCHAGFATPDLASRVSCGQIPVTLHEVSNVG